MSWVITGSEKTQVDQLGIQNVSLLLHGDGNLNDSSPAARTINAFNGAAASSAQSKFGGSSIFFDSTAPIDYLTVSSVAASNGDWTFLHDNTTNYTIETWIRRNSVANSGIICCTTGATADRGFYFTTSDGAVGSLDFGAVRGVSGSFLAASTAGSLISANTWHHVAAVFTAGATATIKLFIDGTQRASSSTSSFAFSSSTPSNPLNVGRFVTAAAQQGASIDGYIDDLRITRGIARYQGSFTPPTAPFPDI
jgi:hypothetical protein